MNKVSVFGWREYSLMIRCGGFNDSNKMGVNDVSVCLSVVWWLLNNFDEFYLKDDVIEMNIQFMS